MYRSAASTANSPAGLKDIVRTVSRDMGEDAADILGPCAMRRYVIVRRAIAVAARAKGYSFPQIGHALNRDHSTVVDYMRKVR